MRCRACDTLLNEREAVAKNKRTGEYHDLCTECYEAYKGALTELEDDSGVEYESNLGGIQT